MTVLGIVGLGIGFTLIVSGSRGFDQWFSLAGSIVALSAAALLYVAGRLLWSTEGHRARVDAKEGSVETAKTAGMIALAVAATAVVVFPALAQILRAL